MQEIKQMLDSREVAEMVEKSHKDLMRDIRRYSKQFNKSKIAPVDFFKENTYIDSKGESRPCFDVTKKGCEFIAHKLTGVKGTIFTARYINRFHEMEELLQKEAEPKLSWFIRKFRGNHIILERDFATITGIDPKNNKLHLFYRQEYFECGRDWNGYGWNEDNEKFKQKYGFDYGNDNCMIYFYPCGIEKALNFLVERKVKMKPDAYEIIMNGLKTLLSNRKNMATVKEFKSVISQNENRKIAPIQVNIIVNGETMTV